MTTKDLKEKYFKFFEEKGHVVIPSASLVPENDPSALFISAGMQPLVPYLLGEKHPAGVRLADVQKCLRTNDIEEVGDGFHLTFFEMLGNWSLGDYWKKESIAWSFEFLTKVLKISKDKLAVSCFAGDKDAPKDEEAAQAWKDVGISENRIFFLGKKDNWWGPVGETGPCGPDTEIFYWTGKGEPSDLVSAEDTEGWVEIWNNVFMEYEKTSDGKYIQLKQKNVDTGMGVERTVSVINKKDSVFEVSQLKKILDKVKKLSKKPNEKYVRIIVDHIRAATFVLGDQKCIAPSNTEQGYVLRKLIRRIIRCGRLLHIEKPFSVDLSKIVVEEYGRDYPELVENQAFIEKYLRLEGEKYDQALSEGQKVSLKTIEPLRINVHEDITVSDVPKIAFDLYQSHGYPLEMFLDDLKEKFGITDEQAEKISQEVNKLMSAHKNLSRSGATQKFKGGLADQSETVVRYHTATHLLNMALKKVLGNHVRQIGSNITGERLRFDFPNQEKLTEDEIKKVEKIVNDVIDEKLPVDFEVLPREEAIKSGAEFLQGEQYPDQVKVYYVGSREDAVSKELCGGPHAKNTGELKHIEIYKQEKMGEGKMRVYARFIS